MKKIILWSIVSLVIVGVAVNVYLWLHKPQVITLRGGDKLTLIGVTYGKHHVAPKIKIAGKLTRGNGAQLDSPDNALVVWIEAEHKPNQYPNYQLMVYDKANTACVGTYTYNPVASQQQDQHHGLHVQRLSALGQFNDCSSHVE